MHQKQLEVGKHLYYNPTKYSTQFTLSLVFIFFLPSIHSYFISIQVNIIIIIANLC